MELGSPFAAIGRAKVAIASVAVTYVASVALGIAMVSTGSAFALERRDDIVAQAQDSAILVADRAGDRVQAALLDFAANLVLGGATSTAAGSSVIGAYPIAAYRGWVGGIVSVDRRHRTRLADLGTAIYYVVTLILQLIPYSIAGGVGVRLGIGAWRQTHRRTTRTWLGLPTDLMKDAALAYAVIAPLFLVASLWEFLAPRG